MENKRTVGFEIRTLSNLIRRKVCSSDGAESVTGMHGWVIGYLYEHKGENVFQKDLEEKFSVRRSTMTAILQLMEKHGLVKREPSKQDGRLKKLILTQKAKDIHTGFTKTIADVEKQLTSGITDEEMETFFSTLEKMKNNIESIDETENNI